MENLGWRRNLAPGRSSIMVTVLESSPGSRSQVWQRCVLIGPGPRGSLTALGALVPLPPMPLPHGGNADPCKEKTENQDSQPPKMPNFNEIVHASKKQTTKKAFRVSWAVYLHILMCLLIKIVLGNFISQRLGQIFQLIMTGIRNLSANLAMR